jgi:hypothetical protein
MEKPTTKISTDLQKFIDKFEPEKFKMIADGIEIRGISNIHRTIHEAQMLIDRMKLNLTVVHRAEMMALRAFEVSAKQAA